MVKYDIVVIGDYLSSVVNGALTVPDFKKITDEMLAVCQEQDIHKIVIDVTGCAGTFSDDDKIEFAKYASGVLKDIIVKYAYIYPHELLNYSSQQVSQGRGLNARAFYSVEDALAWIERN